MLLEQIDELVMKASLAMMFFLAMNVSDRLFRLRRTDAECAIAFLPSEFPMLAECVVNSFRRSALN